MPLKPRQNLREPVERPPRRNLLRRVASAALAASLTLGCQDVPRQRGWNVILISIDTLRPDHLGCYGYGRPTSPSIDAFCERSWVFRRASAQAPSTLLSHASMLTSLLPQEHGASHLHRRPLSPEVPTLASMLRDAGWRTASFNSGGQLAEEFGLAHGFEVYESGAAAFSWAVEAGLGWLGDGGSSEAEREASQRPFFLFLHSYEVHHPYEPDPLWLGLFDSDYGGALPDTISVDLLRSINRGETVIDEADLRHIRAAYDAEIRSMDEAFGTLMAGLERRGLLDETVIILTSDHGEEFGEHGMVGWHSHTLFEELLRVPLVVFVPGPRPGGTDDSAYRWAGPVSIDTRVRSIDIVPTVLELLGLPADPQMSGRSLVPLAGGEQQRPSLASVAFWDDAGEAYHESLTLGPWKWIDGQLFDLEQDPLEQRDVAQRHPEVAAGMHHRLRGLTAERRGSGERVTLDAETEQQLRSLGYVP